MSDLNFADDWITSGWSRGPDGKWIELGQSATVHMSGTPTPPTLTVHDVAGKLNQLEDEAVLLDKKLSEAGAQSELFRKCCTALQRERDVLVAGIHEAIKRLADINPEADEADIDHNAAV